MKCLSLETHPLLGTDAGKRLSQMKGKTFLFEWKRLGHWFPGNVETIFHFDELLIRQTPQFKPNRNGLSLSSFGITIAMQLEWEGAFWLAERSA